MINKRVEKHNKHIQEPRPSSLNKGLIVFITRYYKEPIPFQVYKKRTAIKECTTREIIPYHNYNDVLLARSAFQIVKELGPSQCTGKDC